MDKEETKIVRRRNKLFILAGVLILLSVGYYEVLKLTGQDHETDSSETPIVVVNLPTEDITQLSWTYDGETVTLNDYGDTWNVLDEENFPLNVTAVENKRNVSAYISASRVLEEKGNLSQYGLEDPAMTIRITANDREITCSLGIKNSVTGEYYLKTSDSDNIYLVDAALWDAFACGLYSLVETEEIPAMNTITDIHITSGGIVRNLEYIAQNEGLSYTDKYFWFYSDSNSQTLEPLETSKVTELNSLLTGLVWENCVSYDANDIELESFGLLDPVMKIEVDYKETETVETDETNDDGTAATEDIEYERSFSLWIGNEADGSNYAKLADSNMVYQIDSGILESFSNVSAQSLAPEDVCLMDWDTVASMDITMEGVTRTLQLHRIETENDDGNMEKTVSYLLDGKEIETGAAEDFLDRITSLAVESTVEDKTLESAEMEITFYRNTEAFSEMTLSLGAYDSSFYLVKFNGASRLLVNKNDVNRLKAAYEALDS